MELEVHVPPTDPLWSKFTQGQQFPLNGWWFRVAGYVDDKETGRRALILEPVGPCKRGALREIRR